MSYRRKHIITEVGLGLTLLTCLLFVLGYMIVHRLGGSAQSPTVEVRARFDPEPRHAPAIGAADVDEQPQVLTIEASDSPAPALHTSQLPDPRPSAGVSGQHGPQSAEVPNRSDLR